ncbi:MAG: hypothetical protein ACNS61_03360 [Candidatus Wenzhouxiangella sp. M2_3B_020]
MNRIAGALTAVATLAFVACTVSAHGSGSATDLITPATGVEIPQQAEPRDPLTEMAIRLSSRADPRQRAAGLLYRLSMFGRAQAARSAGETPDAASTIDELENAIRTTTDGAALAWLALACAGAHVREFCIEKGLDDAIVAHDDANFFSRIQLRRQPDVEETRRLLVEAGAWRTYEPERVALWHEAMQRYDWREALEPHGVELSETPFSELSFALLAGFSSFSIPVGLIEACGSEFDIAGDWTDACDEIGAEMAERGRTASQRLLGLRVLANRAEALGDPDLAATYEARLESLRNRYYCSSRALSAVDGTADETLQRDYLKWLEEGGELGALERLAELAELDCSSPPDARAEALNQAGIDPADS